MYILGVNAFHANASATIVSDGRLIATVEGEHFNCVKYAVGFLPQAIPYCLAEAGSTLEEVDCIAIPEGSPGRLLAKAQGQDATEARI